MDSIKINSVGNFNTGSVKMNKAHYSDNLSAKYDSFSPSFKQAVVKRAPVKNLAKAAALSVMLGLAALTGCKKTAEPEIVTPVTPVMPEVPEEIKLFQDSQLYLSEHPEAVQEGLDFVFSLGIIDEDHQAEILNYSADGKCFFLASMIISNDQVREWYLGLNP